MVYRELEATYSERSIFGLIPDSDGLIPKALNTTSTAQVPINVAQPASNMEGKGSWRLAFEMVELDKMARPTHNGTQSGHQFPRKMVLANHHFGHVGTFFNSDECPNRSGCQYRIDTDARTLR
jgi:hypothetical protein